MNSMRSNVFVLVQVGLFELTGFSEVRLQEIQHSRSNLDKVLFDDRVYLDQIDPWYPVSYNKRIDISFEQREFLDVWGPE